jgi:hypothetical protein
MTQPIVVIVSPRSEGRGVAIVEGVELCVSREPFLEAARVLRDRGVPGTTPMVMRREGSDIIALRSTVQRAARLTVIEDGKSGTRFGRWKPRQSTIKPPSVAQTDLEAVV